MPKPKWAPHDGSWGPVKPKFWDIWRGNKESLKKSGYSVRKSDTGEWQVRYIPPARTQWPPRNPKTVFVPQGLKPSLCLKCGKIDLIFPQDRHKACTNCGAPADSVLADACPPEALDQDRRLLQDRDLREQKKNIL